MSLTKKDKKDIIELLKEAKSPLLDLKPTDTMDLIFKGLSTLSMGLIIWIFSTTNQLKQDVEVIKNNDLYTAESLKELKDSRKESFTNDDFTKSINPIITNINKNTLELNSRNDLMKEIEGRLIKLETKNLKKDE
jgi:hypothetical protein